MVLGGVQDHVSEYQVPPSVPPKTSISLPLQTAVCPERAAGAVGVVVSVAQAF